MSADLRPERKSIGPRARGSPPSYQNGHVLGRVLVALFSWYLVLLQGHFLSTKAHPRRTRTPARSVDLLDGVSTPWSSSMDRSIPHLSPRLITPVGHLFSSVFGPHCCTVPHSSPLLKGSENCIISLSILCCSFSLIFGIGSVTLLKPSSNRVPLPSPSSTEI